MRRAFAGLFMALMLGGGLFGCGGPVEVYHYRLTLEVETPDGIRRGESVVGMRIGFAGPLSENAIIDAVQGEALFLDLSPCLRPLVALLKAGEYNLYPTGTLGNVYGHDPDWAEIVRQVDKDIHNNTAPVAAYRRLLGRGPREVGPGDLPDLVTFADVSDPKTVERVDPKNLAGALCPGVQWHHMTLEVTDAPITRGLEKYLTWMPTVGGGYLSGRTISAKGPLANQIGRLEFVRGYKPWP